MLWQTLAKLPTFRRLLWSIPQLVRVDGFFFDAPGRKPRVDATSSADR